MRPERDPVPRARHPWGWLGGILTLGILMAGAVAAALALWENVDIRRLTRAPGDVDLPVLPAPLPPRTPAHPDSAFEVAIYRSAATTGYFPEREYYPAILDRWTTLARATGARVRTVSSSRGISELDPGVLVIAPAAVCLSAEEVAALGEHAHGGGGLVLTWATGARDGSCAWRGWDVVQQMTAAADVRELEERQGLFLSVPAGLPVSGGIEPAARIEVRWDSPLAVAGTSSRVFWSDWAMNPTPASGTDTVDGAVVLRSTGSGGRIAWFGFMEHHGVTQLDEMRIRRLLSNGIRWAAGVPTVEILPWPGGRQAGLMLAQEVSGEARNLTHIDRVAREQQVKPTYFVVSQLLADDPVLASSIERGGEVASHTSDNSVLAGLPAAEQVTRLRRSVSEIRGATDRQPIGLRAPEEMADAATLESWHALGGRYVVGLNGGRTGSPEVMGVDGGEVVLLPRVIKDDYNLLVQERAMGGDALAHALGEGLTKVRALGGLAVLTTHSRLAATPRYVDQVGALLRTARMEGGWWIATGTEVADWTLARRHTVVEVTRWSEDGVEFLVRAPEDHALRDAWVEINLPAGGRGWAPRPVDRPVDYGETPWGIVVPLRDLEAGEQRTIVVGPETEAGVETGPGVP